MPLIDLILLGAHTMTPMCALRALNAEHIPHCFDNEIYLRFETIKIQLTVQENERERL